MVIKNSCFPTSNPLPGKKNAYPNVESRAVPSSTRKLTRIESSNGESLPVSRISSPTWGCPPSKIPVRKQNAIFPAKIESAAPKDKAIFFHWYERHSDIPVRIKASKCTSPPPQEATEEVLQSHSVFCPAKSVFPSATGSTALSKFQNRVSVTFSFTILETIPEMVDDSVALTPQLE